MTDCLLADNKFVTTTYVTDGVCYLVQQPASNMWGFTLYSDDQSWPGGFGCGLKKWWAVSADSVPKEDRDRLEWLLTE